MRGDSIQGLKDAALHLRCLLEMIEEGSPGPEVLSHLASIQTTLQLVSRNILHEYLDHGAIRSQTHWRRRRQPEPEFLHV
jgi:DNA-binding FrmR family transcriptional regulator